MFTPRFLAGCVSLLALVTSCGGNEGSSVVWDEAEQGELSGEPMRPTKVTLSAGDNFIVGTSVPGPTEECIEGPEGRPAPYYPEHESYVDVISFTLTAGQSLSEIRIEQLEIEAVHPACGIPLEDQLGAFTAIASSDRIDWNSDTFENFVALPDQFPLSGAGFAKDEGTDLLDIYQGGFNFGPFAIDPLESRPAEGTYTFWWKEGANRTSYKLNSVVSE